MGGIVECRTFGARLEARDCGAGGRPRLTGYAAKFNTLSRPLGVMRFREKIDPHAFDETLANRPDVRFTLNHDPNHVLGRTAAGTLRLFTDRTGLGFDLDAETQQGRDLIVSVKRGDISDCSFQFRTLDDSWSKDEAGNPIRTLKKVSLHDGDVAAVAYPAYPDTQINARALDQVERRGRESLGFFDHTTASRLVEAELADMMVKVGPTTPLLYGYAAVFGRYSKNTNKRGERRVWVRGAFGESIAGDLITANLVGHDERVFASTADGSVQLAEDESGLRFQIRPSLDRAEYQRIFEMVQRGQVQQMSISYRVLDSVDSNGTEFIHKARLYHISPVLHGACPETYIRAGFGSLESIAAVEASARARELQLADAEG